MKSKVSKEKGDANIVEVPDTSSCNIIVKEYLSHPQFLIITQEEA